MLDVPQEPSFGPDELVEAVTSATLSWFHRVSSASVTTRTIDGSVSPVSPRHRASVSGGSYGDLPGVDQARTSRSWTGVRCRRMTDALRAGDPTFTVRPESRQQFSLVPCDRD
jgi:hypothetical protein